jgi:excisionase family DNA binding protein
MLGMKTSQNTPTSEMPELLSLKETAEILKCHPNTLRQWDKKGILKAVRFGQRRDRRYKKEDILNIVNNKK